jgi:uncharacterized coiled-coil protein SlyX
MGKHDKVIERSSEEFLQNRIKDLEQRLAFANDTNSKYNSEVNKYNKWMSEIEAAAKDRITELEEENTMLREKIAKLVELYV